MKRIQEGGEFPTVCLTSRHRKQTIALQCHCVCALGFLSGKHEQRQGSSTKRVELEAELQHIRLEMQHYCDSKRELKCVAFLPF